MIALQKCRTPALALRAVLLVGGAYRACIVLRCWQVRGCLCALPDIHYLAPPSELSHTKAKMADAEHPDLNSGFGGGSAWIWPILNNGKWRPNKVDGARAFCPPAVLLADVTAIAAALQSLALAAARTRTAGGDELLAVQPRWRPLQLIPAATNAAAFVRTSPHAGSPARLVP